MENEKVIIDSVRAMVDTYQDLYLKILDARVTLKDLELQLEEIGEVLEGYKRK